MSNSNSDHSAAEQSVELHFTEGFFEHVVHVWAGEIELFSRSLTTHMQTGLAALETVQIDDGKEVTFTLDAPPVTSTITVDADQPFIILALRDGEFDITMAARTPGYL